MKRNRGASAIWVTELLVGTALADFDEAKGEKDAYNFAGFEDRNARHTRRR